jgi:hypothetical protein
MPIYDKPVRVLIREMTAILRGAARRELSGDSRAPMRRPLMCTTFGVSSKMWNELRV